MRAKAGRLRLITLLQPVSIPLSQLFALLAELAIWLLVGLVIPATDWDAPTESSS